MQVQKYLNVLGTACRNKKQAEQSAAARACHVLAERKSEEIQQEVISRELTATESLLPSPHRTSQWISRAGPDTSDLLKTIQNEQQIASDLAQLASDRMAVLKRMSPPSMS